ncbi:protein draper-like isoform X2 [Actinia tenebrosa]|nr:protein draper-like isoform X2 [Actinia tenebrosa]
MWGPGCKNTCQCRNNATCDMRNGSCFCLPGWQGKICDRPCQQGYYGKKCALACTCLNGADCDHVTGDCSCPPGCQGQQCNVSCNMGHYGSNCQGICKCQNNAKCDKVTGACSCAHGYQGTFCEKPCNSGFYGNRCQEKCQCEHGSCDHVVGTCSCKAGYSGSRCTETCATNTYGINCSLPCSCPSNAICDPKHGGCTCEKGFIGESCDHKCQSGHYGNQCQEKCSCYSDEYCDPLNGNCTCKHEKCNERLKATKGKSSGASGESIPPYLIPTVTSVIVIILVVICIAIACFVYLKRRNQRMRNKPNNESQLSEYSDASAIHTAKKEKKEIKTKESKPMYMELKGTTERPSQDDVNQEGIYTTYQKLLKKSRESRLSDVGSISMETQYENLGSARKAESVYQPLQEGYVMEKRGEEGDKDSKSAYHSLNRINSDNSHVKYNPGYELESPTLYENSTSVLDNTLKKNYSNGDNDNANLYLELISDAYQQPGNSEESDDQPYEILPPTARHNRPVYDNL